LGILLIVEFFRNPINQPVNQAQNYPVTSSPQPGIAGQSGRGASVVSFYLKIFSKI
jgi:hypothetical protein